MKEYKLPKIDQLYWLYDDGKIKLSRQEIVKVVEVIPFGKIKGEDKHKIIEEVEEHHWLYDKNQDIEYVVYGKNLSMVGDSWENGDEDIIIIPSRIGWYGFGVNNYWNQGLFDVDGSITEGINNEYDFDTPLFPEKEYKEDE